MSKRNIVWFVFVCFAIVLLSIWFFFGSESKTTEVFQKNGNVGEIVDGVELVQTIEVDKEIKGTIKEIGLFLATYKRANTCNLFVNLYSADSLIQSWTIDCSTLKDNSYYWLKFVESESLGIVNRNGTDYRLLIFSDGIKGNAVTIYTSDKVRGLLKSENDTGTTLCYQIRWNEPIKKLMSSSFGLLQL